MWNLRAGLGERILVVRFALVAALTMPVAVRTSVAAARSAKPGIVASKGARQALVYPKAPRGTVRRKVGDISYLDHFVPLENRASPKTQAWEAAEQDLSEQIFA